MKTTAKKSQQSAKSRVLDTAPLAKVAKVDEYGRSAQKWKVYTHTFMKKKLDQKIVFFHGEILILRFEVGIFFNPLTFTRVSFGFTM